MNFENRTRFAALTYEAVDASGEEIPLIVARGTFELRLPAIGRETAAPDEVVTLVAEEADEQAGMVVADEPFGELNRSSVKQESDLAPAKPRCDVIVIGSAHSPAGEPAPRIPIGLRIRRTAAIEKFAEAGTCLDHKLVAQGPRWFVRRSGGPAGAFDLTDPEPVAEVELRYERAFGGELKVYSGEPAAEELRDEHRLTDAVRAKHPEGKGAPIAHTVCENNPLGVGFLEGWYAEAAGVDRWPAPQIEAPNAPITAAIFERMVRGEVRAGEIPELTARGVGVVGRPWLPRRAKAGTFDAAWLEGRWPEMPEDHDIGYWNGAHEDMQCEALFGGELVELWNLLPKGSPGTTVTADGQTLCRFRLPEPILAARLGKGDVETWGLPLIDTVVLDLPARRLSLVWRLAIPTELGVDRAALVSLAPPPQAA